MKGSSADALRNVQRGEDNVVQPIEAILQNRVLITALIAWATAQLLKTVIYLIINRKLVWERLIGDGGMPSSHSATVSSVAMAIGRLHGWSSGIFALAAVMAIIVMHDAMGVRRETGKQAKAINEIIEHILAGEEVDLTPEETLKEFVGHTPLQVAAGCVLGLVIGAFMRL